MLKRRRRHRRNSFGEIETKDGSLTPDVAEERRGRGWSAPSFVSIPNPDHDPDDPASPVAILVPSDSPEANRNR